ncbi:MAG: PQQ-like beta-propeller repeat protein [Alphaproteobacteria bacterium]|nr:PQQ-like beta-propeller repeat protein [Alphaproteobacteria bacterium]
MLRLCIALLAMVVFLSGCEGLFGKESGQRGALPGKREDVFSAERALKADPSIASTAQELPAQIDVKDWMQPGGSATRVHGNIAFSSSPSDAWSLSVGNGSSSNGALTAVPIVVNGKVYTVDAAARVSAFSAQNGDKVWEVTVPAQRPEDATIAGAGIAYDQGRLVVTTSYGFVVELDASTGKQIWQRNLQAPIRSAPIIADGKIYVISMNNTVQEMSFADGSLGWNHAGIQESASFLGAASPTITDDLVIVPYSSGEIFGLRRINGRMAWQENLASTKRVGTLPAMADIEGQPVIYNGRIHIISHSGRFVALDVRSGKRVWEADAGSIQTPWFAGDTIYLVTTENQLAALSAEDGHVRWTSDLPRYIDPENRAEQIAWVGPVLAGGKLWLGNSLGEFNSYNPTNGKLIATRSFSSPIYLPPIVAGRTMYVLSDDGRLTALR